MNKVLQDQVSLWLDQDKNETTRAEIKALAEKGDAKELTARLGSRIQFGTAGLRAKMQAGTAFMNDLVVIQATQGLARYALKTIDPPSGGAKLKVVVGHDHRHNSARFAQLAARVFDREGFEVLLLDGLVHTPMVPFTAARQGCALGLMITASHNPAQDNGYKVYWSNAVQIIPPHDAGIAATIEDSLEVDDGAWVPYDQPWAGTEQSKKEYFAMASSLIANKEDNAATALLFTYTAMHGVGLPFAQEAFAGAGFPADKFSIVAEQAQPDPDFPTVKFPNPEEKGALDLAMKHADKVASTIVLANDPDADRFCAAEKVHGKWNVFTGDQLGSLLGSWVLAKYKESGKPIDKLAFVASTVSSKMLRAMADKEGCHFTDSLTGFKWIGNKMKDLQEQGYTTGLGYEEAIGFALSPEVADKDGVTALITFAEMATQLARVGKTLTAHLDSLYFEYGYFETSNSYFICRDPVKTDRIFSKLRYGDRDEAAVAADPKGTLSLPKTLAGYEVTYLRDLTVGYDSSTPDHEPTLMVDPSAHMLSFAVGSTKSGDGVAVEGTVRTSGTEPKIKFYIEGSGMDRSAVKAKLAAVRLALGVDWLRADEFQLERA